MIPINKVERSKVLSLNNNIEPGGLTLATPHDTPKVFIYNTDTYTTRTHEFVERAGIGESPASQAQGSLLPVPTIPSTPQVPPYPPRFFLDFEIFLKKEAYTKTELDRTLRTWRIVRSILEVDLASEDLLTLPSCPALFYKGIAKRQLALSSAVPIIRLANRLIQFHAQQLKTHLPAPIPPVRGKARQFIEASYNKVGKSHPCLPLTEKKLLDLEGILSRKHWAYLHVSLYLGLRPSELDNSLDHKVLMIDGVKVLKVFQSKLANTLEKEMCYKLIPILEPEQEVAIRFLKGDLPTPQFKKPDHSTIRKHLGIGYGLYSGRKGFSTFALSRGWKFDLVSKSLGHSNLKMTENFYTEQEKLMISMVHKRSS